MNDGGSFRDENVGVLWRKSLLSRKRALDILPEGISGAYWHNSIGVFRTAMVFFSFFPFVQHMFNMRFLLE